MVELHYYETTYAKKLHFPSNSVAGELPAKAIAVYKCSSSMTAQLMIRFIQRALAHFVMRVSLWSAGLIEYNLVQRKSIGKKASAKGT